LHIIQRMGRIDNTCDGRRAVAKKKSAKFRVLDNIPEGIPSLFDRYLNPFINAVQDQPKVAPPRFI